MAVLSTLRRPDPQLIQKYASFYSTHRPLVQKALNVAFALYFIASCYRGLSSGSSPAGARSKGQGKGDVSKHLGKQPRVAEKGIRHTQVDAVFYARLSAILRIVIPSLRSKEALLLAMHSSLLIFRTAISLYVAALDGKIVASLVRAQPKAFLWNILRWLLVAVPATATNSWLSYIQNKLSIAYRTRLTKELITQYLGDDGDQEKVYYKLAHLDDRIKNPDQMMTVDIQRFSNHLSAIYANLAKPILDVILYNYQLSQNVGAEGLILLTVLIQGSAALLRTITPPFGTYTAQEAALSGALRHSHSRLMEAAEEVAFFGGEDTEKILIDRDYFGLVKHINRVLRIRLWHGVAEEGIIKSVGVPGVNAADLGGRTEGFVTNRRLLLSSSDAVGRVMYSYKELSELAGYTARVSLLFETMSDVRKGKFDKALVSNASTEENAQILNGRGKVIESDAIQFENVPVVTPNGDILVRSLSFHVKPEFWVVYGPYTVYNMKCSCILSCLISLAGGIVKKPPASEFILIPQRPYLSLGTLRDQVIYPHSKAEMEHRHFTDGDLLSILSMVEMDHIVDREGGWDAAREWRDALSGGDKQKIAWARLFYHNPKYAVLDEATSHVPPDLETRMMEHATNLGITLLTVSHRSSLWQYHSHILHTKLDAERRLALQEEKQLLETKLLEVPKMRARLEGLRVVIDDQER
ncbi:adrenoleukodystrophy protein [Gautieria morchelliformis]|nr:adrenoleukodystrophy protein [Gautieria morchelliformis]